MRINQFLALASGISRRAADAAIADKRVKVNDKLAQVGQEVQPTDKVTLDARLITPPVNSLTIMLNKPVGYVCSRDGQGSKTIYDLLPTKLHHLKPVGRLDKDSSGLLLLTDDGQLAHELTHPSFQKEKVYEVELDKPLIPQYKTRIEQGIMLDDGMSKLNLELPTKNYKLLTVRMYEGRNRQIRRTFEALGYTVTKLHRTHFGSFKLPGDLKRGSYRQL